MIAVFWRNPLGGFETKLLQGCCHIAPLRISVLRSLRSERPLPAQIVNAAIARSTQRSMGRTVGYGLLAPREQRVPALPSNVCLQEVTWPRYATACVCFTPTSTAVTSNRGCRGRRLIPYCYRSIATSSNGPGSTRRGRSAA